MRHSLKRSVPVRACWLLISAALLTVSGQAVAEWRFVEISEAAGAAWAHDFADENEQGVRMMSGGVAAGDYDGDGDVDLYVVTGTQYPNVLLNNNGDGSFTDRADQAGVALAGHLSNGPVFGDIDADGWLDLVVGGLVGSGSRVFLNRGDGTFAERTGTSGISGETPRQNDFSTAMGDPDGDGDLDLFVTHWGADEPVNHLWLNEGGGRFYPADEWAGIDAWLLEDWSFSAVFTDIDGDFRQDLLVPGDYGSSQVLQCLAAGQFEVITTEVIDDENGMGTAAADFDNDGDVDWFVTSIWDPAEPPTWGSTGNRLYRNDGDGNFVNVTEEAGVRIGHWGWGACAADFDNDGWLDIFHVNGFPAYGAEQTDFRSDRSPLFINNADGSFTERSAELGIDDTQQGRGVVCFDYDLDGDVDIFTQNWEGVSRLYRNELEPNPGFLQVELRGEPANPFAIGARLTLSAGGVSQTRELTVGSNYESQQPLLQHFGLGGAPVVDQLRVRWPHGGETLLENVSPNQTLVLQAGQATPPPFALQSGISAAWYDPSHDGEGFLVELLADGRALLYWFTYDEGGAQDWYFAEGRSHGRRILFPELLSVSGGRFGPDFDPAAIEKTVAGSAAFTWQGCGAGFMDWFIGGAHDRQEFIRLTRLDGTECENELLPDPLPGGGLSGSWYDPSHDGEGFILEMLDSGQALVYWFSYGPQGERRWFYGVGGWEQGKLVFSDLQTTAGGVFGPNFDPETVQGSHWGMLELALDCSGGTATYDGSEPGFGAGRLELVRLSTLAGLECP